MYIFGVSQNSCTYVLWPEMLTYDRISSFHMLHMGVPSVQDFILNFKPEQFSKHLFGFSIPKTSLNTESHINPYSSLAHGQTASNPIYSLAVKSPDLTLIPSSPAVQRGIQTDFPPWLVHSVMSWQQPRITLEGHILELIFCTSPLFNSIGNCC